MTRVASLVLASVVVVALVVGSSDAAPKAGCTLNGTADRDILAGGPGRQVICAKGAGDYGHGQGGNDVLRGGPKNDTLIGGPGADVLEGKGGPDQLFSVDGKPDDRVRGGDGHDRCYGDPGDAISCEVVHRGSLATELALQQQFGAVMVLATSETPSPTPVPTVPVPVPSPTPPQCTPPPASPPPNC